jgi:CDP-diglyceride synthetase
MEPLATWEKILLGALAAVVVVWFWPGLKASLQQSRESKNKDWTAAIIPIAVVILFVILLIALVRA